MGYAVGQPVLWPFPPDWSNPVAETLAWLSDAMQAGTGAQQVRALRDVPRRSFAFQCSVQTDERRIVDAFCFGQGVQQFLLPIWPDVNVLAAPLAVGATAIACDTTGCDFVAGGQAVLWSTPNTWELVTIASGGIAADALTLTAGTANAWAAGTQLWPVRRARLMDVPKAQQLNDEVAQVSAQVLLDEPCDWPAAWSSSATYRGLPVLEWRNEESNDPSDQYDRLSGSVDMDVGPVFYFDLPGMPFRAQSQDFKLWGRSDRASFRSLLYQLAGRTGELWVPSWMSDARLAAAVSDTATQIQVAYQADVQFGYQQQNRRDLRIELNDGTVLYRRVTGSAISGDNEVLQLDSALGVAVDPGAVRQINWMSVCAQAADTVQISHLEDIEGEATSTLNWQAVKSDV